MDHLPNELLAQVFELLGCGVERHVTAPVCKRWAAIAQSVGRQHLHVSPYQHTGFLSADCKQIASPAWEQRLECFTLDINWDPVKIGTMGMKKNRQWQAQFQSQVDQLRQIIKRCSTLSDFRLTDSCLYPSPPNIRSIRPIHSLICSHASLTTLTLDLRYHVFGPMTESRSSSSASSGASEDKLHVCEMVAPQINTLRHLHLRIPRVCSRLFHDIPLDSVLSSLRSIIIDVSGNHAPQRMLDLLEDPNHGCAGEYCAYDTDLVQTARAWMDHMPQLETMRFLGIKSSPGRPRRTAIDCETLSDLEVDCGKLLPGVEVFQAEDEDEQARDPIELEPFVCSGSWFM